MVIHLLFFLLIESSVPLLIIKIQKPLKSFLWLPNNFVYFFFPP
jgi:hypothetical protein